MIMIGTQRAEMQICNMAIASCAWIVQHNIWATTMDGKTRQGQAPPHAASLTKWLAELLLNSHALRQTEGICHPCVEASVVIDYWARVSAACMSCHQGVTLQCKKVSNRHIQQQHNTTTHAGAQTGWQAAKNTPK